MHFEQMQYACKRLMERINNKSSIWMQSKIASDAAAERKSDVLRSYLHFSFGSLTTIWLLCRHALLFPTISNTFSTCFLITYTAHSWAVSELCCVVRRNVSCSSPICIVVLVLSLCACVLTHALPSYDTPTSSPAANASAK